uniref:Uncharacterized protein n=1 Tax=Panagrellus redivivus TaxID=6233 RepID=A0A7E4ZVU8_PANRE
MSLSLLARQPMSMPAMRFAVIRLASTAHSGPKAAKQVTVNPNISGFFKYERDVSRDSRYANPQKLGDTATRFLLRRLGHAYEVYPLLVLTGWWFIIFCYVVYHSFEKVEIWLDRSQEKAPWDWERLRNDYWKKPTVIFDPQGVTHKRLEIMEALQDEMVEAAKKRGTR